MKWIATGVVLLVVWIVVTFVAPVGLGVIHVLLGTGVLMVIRGWVELEPGGH